MFWYSLKKFDLKWNDTLYIYIRNIRNWLIRWAVFWDSWQFGSWQLWELTIWELTIWELTTLPWLRGPPVGTFVGGCCAVSCEMGGECLALFLPCHAMLLYALLPIYSLQCCCAGFFLWLRGRWDGRRRHRPSSPSLETSPASLHNRLRQVSLRLQPWPPSSPPSSEAPSTPSTTESTSVSVNVQSTNTN
jgi:hypothetical protein